MRTRKPSSSSVRKPDQAVAERDQVVGDDVVAVLGEDLVGELPALVLLAQPEQVLAELDLGGQVVGVELERPLLGGRPLGEAVLLRELAADQVVDLGVRRPARQGRLRARRPPRRGRSAGGPAPRGRPRPGARAG